MSKYINYQPKQKQLEFFGRRRDEKYTWVEEHYRLDKRLKRKILIKGYWRRTKNSIRIERHFR